PVLHDAKCFPAAGNHGRLHFPAPKNLVEQTSIGGIVVDDQHWQTAQAGWLEWLYAHPRRPLQSTTGREMKGAPLPRRTFQPETAAHQLHQLSRNGQPESGAPVFAGRRSVGLHERLENGSLLFGCDADTRVSNGKMQTRFPGSNGLDFDTNDYLACL